MPVKNQIDHRVRLADRNDLPRLQDIATEAWGEAAPDLSGLQNEESSLFVAEWRTAIDGFIILLPVQDGLLVHRVAVAADMRERGIGSALLDFASHHAGSLGLPALNIQQASHDRAAIAWATRRGFSLHHHAGNRLFLRRPLQ